ncbi:hypothetical protein ISF_04399 [Cordyceps fumosorosea ARSEF 2679]|uniref:PSI domain-containing protein n=1 Tax=Cordyceps fumosorosea (strain ARSEF 2679) TaxID=1081104 RepID=A0A167XHQ4_CORFA|nr:hypothetical protein ISF_04399 [Cordyceps fumosorosea ARSEF 2679]OAA64989.1 hypothetical protein ISF_04399 [Cordyceps fumosorosea ARSEF 2679]
MDSSISLQAVEAARNNFTVTKSDFEHFLRCWAQQNCDGCINTAECSWCPYSWACVPNKHQPAFLAPIYHDDVCPASAERWELRTRPFGCRASTYTVLSVGVGVSTTLLAVVLLWLLALALRHVRKKSRAATRQRYVATWWTGDDNNRGGGETRPLLPGQ